MLLSNIYSNLVEWLLCLQPSVTLIHTSDTADIATATCQIQYSS